MDNSKVKIIENTRSGYFYFDINLSDVTVKKTTGTFITMSKVTSISASILWSLCVRLYHIKNKSTNGLKFIEKIESQLGIEQPNL